MSVSLFGMGVNLVLFMIVYFIPNIAIAFISSLISIDISLWYYEIYR